MDQIKLVNINWNPDQSNWTNLLEYGSLKKSLESQSVPIIQRVQLKLIQSSSVDS